MFRKKTVFILGAGASWHYGYPTGEDLVKAVINKANVISKYFKHSCHVNNGYAPKYILEKKAGKSLGEAWKAAYDESENLQKALTQINPLVIDYFLHWKPALRSIGTLLIAWVILECEARWQANPINQNRRDPPFDRDNWYRFLIHQLAIGCENSSDLLSGELTFVTFNYDVSLENALTQALEHIDMFKADDVKKFLAADRFLHIYGAIRPVGTPPSDLGFSEPLRDPTTIPSGEINEYQARLSNFLDKIFAASSELRVIDPHNKETDKRVIALAREAIAKAECVYILGYGFDENNSARLDLRASLDYQKGKRCVYFTNFENKNRVNKIASKLFYGNYGHSFPLHQPWDGDRGSCFYEKSIRDVYAALELDFDPFE
jgi:hypothetical protein